MTIAAVSKTVYDKIDKAIDVGNIWLAKHPIVAKTVMVAMHIIRALPMAALMYIMPFGPVINFTVSLGLSFAYYAVIEKGNCAYRFSLLSCVGGEAMLLAKESVLLITQKAAFESLKNFSFTVLGVALLAVYIVGVILTANRDINARVAALKKSANQSTEVPKTCCNG